MNRYRSNAVGSHFREQARHVRQFVELPPQLRPLLDEAIEVLELLRDEIDAGPEEPVGGEASAGISS